jgi:hypothetical protein
MELAWALAVQAEPERAARLLGAAIGFRETAGAMRQRTDKVCEERTCRVLRDQLDASTIRALLDEGRDMALEQAVRDALTEPRAVDTEPASITSMHAPN